MEQEGAVDEVGGGERGDRAHARVKRPSYVVLVEEISDDDGFEVNWLDVEREERSLKTKDVPLGYLVATGHREETFPSRKDAVPSLDLVVGRYSPLSTFYLNPG